MQLGVTLWPSCFVSPSLSLRRGAGPDPRGRQHPGHADLPGGHGTQRHAAPPRVLRRRGPLPEREAQQVSRGQRFVSNIAVFMPPRQALPAP